MQSNYKLFEMEHIKKQYKRPQFFNKALSRFKKTGNLGKTKFGTAVKNMLNKEVNE